MSHPTRKEGRHDGVAVYDNTPGHKHSHKEDRSSKSLHGAENETKHESAVAAEGEKSLFVCAIVLV